MSIQIDDGIERILLSKEQIQKAICQVGKELSEEYANKPLLLVGILKGSFVFLADLARAVTIPCEINFLQAKSYYASTESSGEVSLFLDLEQRLEDYHVLIVEDILDTGRTLARVAKILRERNPRSLRIITLLDKPDRRVVPLQADWVLFTIPDVFVVGYGLDYGERYRNLPYIAVLD